MEFICFDVVGLSVVQRCNTDAVLLTHENTMNRIGKGDNLHLFSYFCNYFKTYHFLVQNIFISPVKVLKLIWRYGI
jgi:hypothetical protein